MRILLSYPAVAGGHNDYFLTVVPAGLISIAASLQRDGHEVLLANDSTRSWRTAVRDAVVFRPDVAGVSLLAHNRTDGIAFIRALKRRLPQVLTVAGGPHAAALAEPLLRRVPELDVVVQGEGEEALRDLCRRVAAGEQPRGIIRAPRLRDLDALPPAAGFAGAMTGIDPAKQFGVLITSRGCPEQCAYCCSPTLWGRQVRFRSPDSLLAELRLVRRRFGLREFSVRDDNFLLQPRRVREFARGLRGWRWSCQARAECVDARLLRDLQATGLEHIQLGLESASARVLAALGRRDSSDALRRACDAAQRAGVGVSVYLMTGTPGETTADIEATAALVRELQPDGIVVSPVAYYPGTTLYAQAKAAGAISDDVWFDRDDAGIFVRTDKAARAFPARFRRAIAHG